MSEVVEEEKDVAEKKEKEKTSAKHRLKRPGLFAVKAILENAKEGCVRFSELAEMTEGVSNRRDCVAYLDLLKELGWIRIREQFLPTFRYNRPGKTFRFYELTDRGQAFLDLFPKVETGPKKSNEESEGRQVQQ